jgi:Glycosyltransferase like family
LLAAGDGCFIACRKAAAQAVRWDEETFNSFHLYDIDFCLRARNSGLRVGVAREVTINHLSQGSFDAGWQQNAERFVQKHHIPPGPEAINQWISIQVGARADAVRVARNLMGLLAPDFQQRLAALQARCFVAACGEFPLLAGFKSSLAERAQ